MDYHNYQQTIEQELSDGKTLYWAYRKIVDMGFNGLVQALRYLILNFRRILSKGTPLEFDQWMENALLLGKKKLNTLVNGMKMDIEAIYNAITTSLSSGMVEGNVNRLKNIKRQMYGRASFELLKRKVILSKTG